MTNFVSKLFMTIGALGFIFSLLFLWAYFVGSAKAGTLGTLFILFFVGVIISILLFCFGDFVQKVSNSEKTIETMISDIEKYSSVKENKQ